MQKLAGRGKNGAERCERHGPLSRLEPARCWNFFTRIGKSQHPGARPPIPIQGLPWSKDDYLPGTYILSTNYYQIELLTNLDQTPESGALVVLSFLKPTAGSGFPARVFAICPKADTAKTRMRPH